VRFRTGGERLRTAWNRPRRTLKNLFQEAGIPAPLRERWPLLAVDDDLIAVPGVAVGVDWQCPPGGDGWIVTWEVAPQRKGQLLEIAQCCAR
jgi:tRNA(Ile)-lysidine synthase